MMHSLFDEDKSPLYYEVDFSYAFPEPENCSINQPSSRTSQVLLTLDDGFTLCIVVCRKRGNRDFGQVFFAEI